jgi:hypothetical protein
MLSSGNLQCRLATDLADEPVLALDPVAIEAQVRAALAAVEADNVPAVERGAYLAAVEELPAAEEPAAVAAAD